MATKKKPEQIYTDPELRERLKSEIMAGDKGGKPEQWSARKAQLLAHEYEKQGGGYKTDGQLTESQAHLKEWTAEEWTTRDGKPAEAADGTMHRYLPKAAWENLTPAEQAATDRKKVEASRKGEQFADNTAVAKAASKAARADPADSETAQEKQEEKREKKPAAKKPAAKRKTENKAD